MADDKVAIWGSGLKFGRNPANGELLIGNGQDLTMSTLTAGSGVSISNAAGAVTISATGIVGALGVPSGGTGQTSLTLNNVILGNGTNPVQFVAPGTNGNVLTSNGTTWTSTALPNQIPSQTGNSGKVLTTDGTTASWGSSVIRGTAAASTSGTEVDFTGIPSWVRRVTVVLRNVSTNGTSNLVVRVGSGSYETTGYSSGASVFSASATVGTQITNGFPFEVTTASLLSTAAREGSMTITNITDNVWVASSTIGYSAGNLVAAMGGGSISLAGVLDRVRLTTPAGNTFDAGTVNIFWE